MTSLNRTDKPPVIFDTESCTSCGICSMVCIFSVIVMDNQSGCPTLSPHAPPCSRCGHCVAFCPASAIHLSGTRSHTPSPPSSQPRISPGQIRDLVLTRRSVRKYQKKEVPRQTLESLFDIIRYAPSAMNLQTVHWQVIYDTRTVQTIASAIISWMNRMIDEKRLDDFAIGSSFPFITGEWEKGRDLITHRAPHLLISYARPDELTASTDAIIATSYLDLIAPVFELGTCWTGIIKRAAEWSPEVQAALNLPPGTQPQTALLIGYPLYRQYSVPERESARIRWKG